MSQTTTPNISLSASDFERVEHSGSAQKISRPSLSYWQDAWIRLKKNTRAVISLYIVIGLGLFTTLGPVVWTVDPSVQDLTRISQGPSFGAKALVVEEPGEWEALVDENHPEYPEEEVYAEDLGSVSDLKVVDLPTTFSVRLQWQPVEGAAGYAIYRNERKPTGADDLGIPLGEVDAGNKISYEDRLKLEARQYYYSVVASDGSDESPEYTSVQVEVVQALNLEKALNFDSEAQVGEKITVQSHPLGTDYLGRDLLSRLMYGARVSMFIGFCGPLLFVIFGTLYGGIAGYFGGRLDNIMMRISDLIVALPFLLVMILFRIGFGIGPGESGVTPMLIAFVAIAWPATARLVRGQVLQLREEGFIQAGRLLGARPAYLLIKHMIPNTMGVILVTLTFAIPSAIFTEAFLSFIGMGVAPPTPSWGSMCNEGVKLMLSHPHELLFPAAFISVTVLAFNLLGDGLRDALDARMRSRE